MLSFNSAIDTYLFNHTTDSLSIDNPIPCHGYVS